MSDQDKGGNTEEKESEDSKTQSEGDGDSEGTKEKVVKLSESDLKDLIKASREEGLKTGEARSHSKFQSQADKQVSKAKVTLEAELEDTRKQLYERMSPEEQDREDRRRLERKIDSLGAKSSGDDNSNDAGSPSETTESGDEQVEAVQKQVREHTAKLLKDAGLDPEKVKVEGDLDTFIKDLIKEAGDVALARKIKETEDEDEDAKRNGLSQRKSKGGGNSIDLATVDTMELIKQGARDRLRK